MMEEESGVKAPVTRLRRRLSVEQADEGKSPGPATPTKKRGGRLAAKPQLELIDEHAANTTPSKRSTRKVSTKEVAEGTEEKAITPARRSTRIKSNTSIVSETTQSFDSPRAKRAARRNSQVGSDSELPVTPIRQTRRTRKDSSSSIEKLEVTLSGKPNITEVIIEEETDSVKSDDTTNGSENTQSSSIRKSPRLKGKPQGKKGRISVDKSNNEIDNSNGKNSEDQLNVSKQNKNLISLEQPSSEFEASNNSSNDNKSNVSKQKEKKERTSLLISDEGNNASTEDILNISKQNILKKRKSIEKSYNNIEINSDEISSDEINLNDSKKIKSKGRKSNQTSDDNIVEEQNTSTLKADPNTIQESSNILHSEKTNETENLSDSSLLIIKELDKKPKKTSSNLNKSTSSLEIPNNLENKRQRTKSWTTTSLTPENNDLFYSDNETAKKNLRKKTSKDIKRQLNHTGSGDSTDNNEKLSSLSADKKLQLSNSSLTSNKPRISREFLSPPKTVNTNENSPITETISPQGNKENILIQSTEELCESSIKFFDKAPTAVLQSIVYFEDSDTDRKVDNDKLLEGNIIVKSDDNDKNSTIGKNYHTDSCEPMDIDVTLPNNVSLAESSQTKINNSSHSKKQNSNPSSPAISNTFDNSQNKSKRKSSLSYSHNLEKSETENRSTLILSQLKDVSSTDHNVTKSPKLRNDLLSKSIGLTDTEKDKILKNKEENLSQDYSTSTPLQQKRFQKLGIQINSSIIDSSNIEIKKEKSQNTSQNDISQTSETASEDDESDLEDEESKDRNTFLDEEADVASDNYESGDSRDDDERQYEEENEIKEKGETLDSDDDYSNDTDYEKDSFVVSSDEEDNELLSGSGDDLSMSDKELTFSRKSKKKYDERKQKEQKKASKEMYEARHKLNTSDSISKSKKTKIKKLIVSDESEEEIIAPAKKNKRLRLNSTHDDDTDRSNSNKPEKNTKSKRFSESACDENLIREQEISTSINKNVSCSVEDPLSIQVKLEPKTPMKELNISTVQINENIEEVIVDTNMSTMKTDDAIDPLQATMMNEEDSYLSENSDIMNNYDSVLKELNEDNQIKTVKSLDMSLNLNKKTKPHLKEPIIDQLNLTKTKQRKSIVNNVVDLGKLNMSQSKKKLNTADAESSSDSIDLQLLFSEHSNDYDNAKDKRTISKDTGELDDFIPLKRTPGKTNILLSEGNNEQSDGPTLVNHSSKKKNKKQKLQSLMENNTDDDQANNNDIQIIVDTQGTHENTDKSFNIPLDNSIKKNNDRNSVSLHKTEEWGHIGVVTNDDDDGPVEVAYESTKSKKKNRKSTETHTNLNLDTEVLNKTDDNIDISKSGSKKKKKLLSESHTDQALDIWVATSKSQEDTNVSQIILEEIQTMTDLSLNNSMGSSKKKKQKCAANGKVVDTWNVDKNLSIGSAKKYKSHKEKLEIETVSSHSEETVSSKKKRKRKSSESDEVGNIVNEEKDTPVVSNNMLNESIPNGHQNKKRKIGQEEGNDGLPQDVTSKVNKKNKKRKERDDDDEDSVVKMFKENSFDKVHITRLPTFLISRLEDKPKKQVLGLKKLSVTSTTPFIVEDTKSRRNKPSEFLEESVYLNDSYDEKKQKGKMKKPKVLPFIPTAVTSASGCTTNFKINIIPQEVQFVAQTKNVPNFKNEYLYGKKIKRLGTYETYKKHRNTKLSKF